MCCNICVKVCLFLRNNPVYLYKFMVLLSTGLVFAASIEVPLQAKARWDEPAFGRTEYIHQRKKDVGYNDFKYVTPVVAFATAICIIGWIGAITGFLFVVQIFTWCMFVCFLAMYIFTIASVGGDHHVLMKQLIFRIYEKYKMMTNFTATVPYRYEIGVVIQQNFQCCGMINRKDWDWYNKQFFPQSYPHGCCSKIGEHNNCNYSPIWPDTCLQKIRKHFFALLDPMRKAYFIFCFSLIHAAVWGSVLTFEMMKAKPLARRRSSDDRPIALSPSEMPVIVKDKVAEEEAVAVVHEDRDKRERKEKETMERAMDKAERKIRKHAEDREARRERRRTERDTDRDRERHRDRDREDRRSRHERHRDRDRERHRDREE